MFFTTNRETLDKELLLWPLAGSDDQNIGNSSIICKNVQMGLLLARASSTKNECPKLANCADPFLYVFDLWYHDWKVDGKNSPGDFIICNMTLPSLKFRNALCYLFTWLQGAAQVAKGSGRGITSFSTMASGKGMGRGGGQHLLYMGYTREAEFYS